MPIATSDVARAARLFHALSDETRLQVIEMLRTGERCVCELQDALDVAQSRLSFHLKVLKDVGVVTDRKDGRWVHYSLDRDTLDEMGGILADFRPTSRRIAPRVLRSAACCD